VAPYSPVSVNTPADPTQVQVLANGTAAGSPAAFVFDKEPLIPGGQPVWSTNIPPRNLNHFIPSGSTWQIKTGVAINNFGAIVATATCSGVDPLGVLPPAQFKLRNNANVFQGWDSTGWDEVTSKKDNPPATSVGVGKTNSLVKLMLPGYPLGNSLGLQLVVAQDGGQNLISLTNNTIWGPESDFNIVAGSAPGTATVNLQLQSTGQVILTLIVRVLAPQTVTIDIHVTTDSNSQGTNIPQPILSARTPAQVIAELNAVFGPQANITFQLGDTSPANIHYDPNQTGALDSTSASDFQLFPQPRPGHLQLYEIYNISATTGSDAGYTREGQGPCVVALGTANLADFAHEVGHALFLSTMNDPNFPYHDEGPWPVEFQAGQLGLMYHQHSDQMTNWIREYDWKKANETAATQYH